jgi:steroid delta-isomerase-like uncharacterized protein
MWSHGRVIGMLAFAVATAAGPLAAQTSSQEVAEAYLAAWNAHDPEAAAALLADDVVYLDVTVGEPQKGRAAARDNVIQVFMTAAPDLKWERTGQPVVSADGIAFEWTFGGTNTGAWGPDTPATGKAFQFDGVTLMHIEGGKITYQVDSYDGLSFQKQLGWIE